MANIPTVLVQPGTSALDVGGATAPGRTARERRDIARGPDRSDAARDAVVAAFVLGWHVAELFHANAPGAQRRPAGVDRLTGIGELDPLSRARLLLAQVRVDLEVAWQFGRSNQDPRTPALSRRCWRPTCASRASSGRPWPSCTASC